MNAVRPVGTLKASRTSGDRAIIPMKPSTTDGIPATTSIIGLRISRSQRGATSATKIAASTPVGTAMIAAPSVTSTDPRISGSSPK